MKAIAVALSLLMLPTLAGADQVIPIWPDLAPGETTKETGSALPRREGENPPATRISGISLPTMEVLVPEAANGTAVVILPGGGYRYVVTDKEGSEAGRVLNQLGITAFVLSYRTITGENETPWKRPLQDSRRAIRYVRAHANQWSLEPDKIGLLAFSAGGQVGAIHIGDLKPAYEPIDEVDQHIAQPDFAMLIYPWQLQGKDDALKPEIQLSTNAPPTFLVHAHDDGHTSLGTVYLYAALKKLSVPAELHIYENGGHGYGVRTQPHSNVGTWTDRMVDWLTRRELGRKP